MEIDSKFVVPGTKIDISFLSNQNNSENPNENTPVILGPGLLDFESGVISYAAGELQHNSKDTIWVDFNKKRYVPAELEPVIGTVVARHAEGYRVDIGSAHIANLNSLAFENATKRNKPNLNPGTLVYGRVCLANKFLEPEIECYNSNTNKADGYGELADGFLIKTSLKHCRRLLKQNPAILTSLGEHLSFEIAIGLNGFVWIKSQTHDRTILIANAIKNSEFLSDADCKLMVTQLISSL
ncbi:hypothetical protein BB559_005512 [Furculomyces boomerangus]|uniref:Ribosomal RNA-processing protein 40 n=2 Tax=Harpellales TaxID=61421 RepID=A0A2T9Y8E6_9FUNG|nr:hypothetical protein BB559_005512 [Furculomyces boomerangus]PVZ99877.1 hypothetical protein BB558_004089 [Smittium angustum]